MPETIDQSCSTEEGSRTGAPDVLQVLRTFCTWPPLTCRSPSSLSFARWNSSSGF
jgi:hypothetical protein